MSTPFDLPLVLRALVFAAERHRGQARKDAARTPYIHHPVALATVLWEAGIRDAEVIAAAILHDTIEDTPTTRDDLEQFGEEVARIVALVTDDKRERKADRKRLQAQHAGDLPRAAKLVKLADKICNVRDIADSPPHDWSVERKREYFDWAKGVVDALRGTDATLEAAFDAAYARKP